MNKPADRLDAILDMIRTGSSALDEGYAELVHYARALLAANSQLRAENLRQALEIQQLRGEPATDQTIRIPRVGRRRAPRGLRRKPPIAVPPHSHRKPTDKPDQEARHR